MAKADKKEYRTNAEASSGGTSGMGKISGLNPNNTSANCEPAGSYYVELSKSYAELSKQYYEKCSIGMVWIPIKLEDWTLDNDRYKAEFKNLLAVAGTYKGNWAQKKLVNVDMTITDEKTIIYSYEAFEGFVLGSYAIIESEDAMGIMEVLEAMLDTNIIDITQEI